MPSLALILLVVATLPPRPLAFLGLSAGKTRQNSGLSRFDEMIKELSLPDATIAFIDSPKQRTLFRGVSAAASEAKIRNAFAIVFEDIAPIRTAGEMVFSVLNDVAVEASERAASAGDVRAFASLARSRNLFRNLDCDSSGALSRAEILASPELLALLVREGDTEEDAEETVGRFMRDHDRDGNGELSFVEFANAVAAEPLLKQAMDDEAAAVDDDHDGGAAATAATEVAAAAASAAALAESRRLFDFLDDDASGELDRSELLASPELLALLRREDGEGDEEAVERFMQAADRDADGSISFAEFALVPMIAAGGLSFVDDALAAVDEALERTAALEAAQEAEAAAAFAASPAGGLLSRRKRRKTRGGVGARSPPEERFESMLAECLAWEETIVGSSSGDEGERHPEEEEGEEGSSSSDGESGRLLQVIEGALAGARCKPVTEALLVCYLEYSALRFGGDLIFKLMRRTVAAQKISKAKAKEG